MAKRPTRKLSQRKQLRNLIDALEPSVAKAFRESIDDIRDKIVLIQVVKALEKRDIDAALKALNIENAAFKPLSKAIAEAFDAGGSLTAKTMKKLKDRSGAEVVLRFDVENPRANKLIKEHSGKLITQITEDALESSRFVISEGYKAGKGPKSIALDLAGRKDRVSGKRVGGKIGLSEPQTKHVANMRSRLSSGTPSEMRKVLGIKLRYKRFDRTLLKHIEAGTKLSDADVNRMVGRYSDNAIMHRSKMIARTETGTAVMESKYESFNQGLDKTGYTEDAVTRVWRTAGGPDVRHTHAAMDGQTVKGMKTPFVSPSGARLLYPFDTSLGAGPSETVSCKCDMEINIDFSEGLE
ncbi:MAG: head morphogenesis protein [Hyphomicrobiales bacterium]|nr:MAG: head morphogenesis protein [Hyphomicrobiales bacterium]